MEFYSKNSLKICSKLNPSNCKYKRRKKDYKKNLFCQCTAAVLESFALESRFIKFKFSSKINLINILHQLCDNEFY